MSSNNNDNNGAVGAVILVLAGLYVLGIFVFAFLIFITFVTTFLAILAWRKPLTIGKWTLAPEEARAFVWRGICCVLLTPAFLLLVNIALNVTIQLDFTTALIGYMFGSLGIEMLISHDKDRNAPPAPHTPPEPQLPAPPRQSLPRQKPESFRFARWDDEEERE
ncbi:hypothetical protein [Rhizobium sp. CF142]|uniref:hypothetical protein n=1 Tax=Rhizobium sp. CF142 TaxID=1144314 RepID=UPI00026F012C|nr:hypothetical protein [Rhizobium sp. CF142]EJJ27301.1 hypothetical protein PMI11_04313 [Rhizobium sp. CF142]